MSEEVPEGQADISEKDKKIDWYARRCFRDTADHDYIAARMCWHGKLYAQFRWQALHSLEKYLKGILLFHRVEALGIKHELGKLLTRSERLPFELRLSDASVAFIRTLDRDAQHRYLEASYSIEGPALLHLDRAVWEVRRYCRRLTFSVGLGGGEARDCLEVRLREIAKSDERPPHRFRLKGGLLEGIIDDCNHPARPALIRDNAYFGEGQANTLQGRASYMFVNSPGFMFPEVLDEVMEYVYWPERLAKEYRKLAAAQSGEGSK